MADPLLTRVKSKLHLTARRRVTHALDGQYRSLQHGRSMDFEDLREYTTGDEVKDIDWNATARLGTTLVKRYHAERRHRMLFVVDRGRNMAAQSDGGTEKRMLAVLITGILGYLAIRHGDEVALATGDAESHRLMPYRTSERELERMLHEAHDHVSLDGPQSDLPGLLQHIRQRLRGHHFLVVIADETELTDEIQELIRRLTVQHELVWIEIADANPLAGGNAASLSYDVSGSWRMPSLLAQNKQLAAELRANERNRTRRLSALVTELGASFARVHSEEDVMPALIELLKRRGRTHA